MKIRVAHSPDADDHFLFWAIKSGRVPTGEYDFEFVAMDTEDLNRSARGGEFDIIAVSLATLPTISHDYAVLSSGASVGRGYGPKLIAKRSEADRLKRLLSEHPFSGVVGIPGDGTTAALLLRKLIPGVKTVEIPLSPFQGIFQALKEERIQAAVVIHEGQLSYQEFDCELLTDLGQWWFEKTRLPIPVGINVIHKRLGTSLSALSALCQSSVRFALDHVEEVMPELLRIDAEQGGKLRNAAAIQHYLSLYANEDSYSLPRDAQEGIVTLLSEQPKNSFQLELI